MCIIEWDRLKAYYFVRKNNRAPESYYLPKYKKLQFYFKDKDFTQDNVDLFLAWVQEDFIKEHNRTMSSSYYNKYICMLHHIGKLMKVDFVNEYEGKPSVYVETECLTDEECEKLLSVDLTYSRESEKINYRWKTIIKVLIVTTLRPGNLRDATWCNFKDNVLYIPLTKNGTSHKVFLPEHLANDVRQLSHSSPYIFGDSARFDLTELNKEIKKRCQLVGITKHITAKSMRKTGITSYLKKYQAHKVAKISNHKTIDVFYKHYYNPEDEELKEIVRHNAISPEPPTKTEFVDDYRHLSDKYRDTTFSKLAGEVEKWLVGKLH